MIYDTQALLDQCVAKYLNCPGAQLLITVQLQRQMKFSDAAAVVFNVVVVCVLVVVCSVATASAASFPVKQIPLKQYQT